jgi:Soluble NSF attachment protein, SNAP
VDAVQAYEAAISLLTDAGRLTQAAKLCKECAELFETADEMVAAAADSNSTISNAIQFYEQASELYGRF